MSTAVATTQPRTVARAPKPIRATLEGDQFRQAVAKVLPKHLTPERFVRVAVTAITRTPKLAQCDEASFFNALLNLSQLGLEPDGRRAHLIPFENRKRGTVECQLIIDWKGLAELALRSGMIAKLHADLICDKDEFSFDMGDILHHRINFREPRGEPYAAYAMAVTKTGEKFVQVMPREEIEKIRDGSQGWKAFKAGYAKQSPWQDAPGEMWKKTVFRRLSKWLPLSPEFRDALEAEDADAVEAPRTEVLKPIFDPQPKGLFELPEPQAAAELPQPDAPEEASQEPQEAQPEAQPAPEPANGKPAVNHVRAVKNLLKLANHTEAELLDFLRATRKADDSLSSLEEIATVAPSVLQAVYDGWAAIDKEMKKAKAQ